MRARTRVVDNLDNQRIILAVAEYCCQQYDFFISTQSEELRSTVQVLDKVNRNYGQGSLFLGKQGIQCIWSMERLMKSPTYITRLKYVRVVK